MTDGTPRYCWYDLASGAIVLDPNPNDSVDGVFESRDAARQFIRRIADEWDLTADELENFKLSQLEATDIQATDVLEASDEEAVPA